MHASTCFDAVAFDPERYDEDAKLPPAAVSYLVFFTPRSGSSWLTETILHTGKLGHPAEWFNPDFIPEIASFVNANTPARLIEMLRRTQAPGNVFGAEVAFPHINYVFGGGDGFRSAIPPIDRYFFLVREDIVEQAVSLAKAVATNVFHAANSSPEEILDADARYEYDGRQIKDWLDHIAIQERHCEEYFEQSGIQPVRLSYERMIEAGAHRVVSLFAQEVGASVWWRGSNSRHKKIGTAKNAALAERFRSEYADHVAEIEASRRVTVELLTDIPHLRTRALVWGQLVRLGGHFLQRDHH